MSGEVEAPQTEIRDGIEWFGEDGQENQCARCGSSAAWLDCWQCGGGGLTDHDCGEDSCCCEYPDPNVECDACGGSGGSWHCGSSPDWCRDNPMPGREGIVSTALNIEAWDL